MTDALVVPPSPRLTVVPGRSSPAAATGPRGRRHLRVVDGPTSESPGPDDVRWAQEVGELAARALGTDFTPVAVRLAVTARTLLPAELSRGGADVWAAAVVFLLAEHTRLFEFDRCVSRTSFARELGPSLSTLRRRAAVLRPVLASHLPLVADPDP